jgi:site-specific recombinase XerD
MIQLITAGTASTAVNGQPTQPAMTAEAKAHRAWIDSTRPKKTMSGIQTYTKQFIEWCNANDRQYLPASPLTVAEFMKFVAIDRTERKPLATSTVEHAVRSAISNLHTANGYPTPTQTPVVRDTISAINRTGTPGSGGKLPLTIQMMRMISQHFGCNVAPINDRNRAMMLIGMAGLLRGSEIAALGTEDVWIEDVTDDPSQKPLRALFIFIEKSKTDPYRRGETVVVSEAADMKMCPIVAYEEWALQRHRNHRFDHSEHLFCNMTNGAAISRATVNHILKDALEAVGVDPDAYGSHSLRKGGATAMAAAKVEERLIKRHGRWRSNAVHVYITDPTVTRLAAAASIFCAPLRGG